MVQRSIGDTGSGKIRMSRLLLAAARLSVAASGAVTEKSDAAAVVTPSSPAPTR
jgi:hypothetical protein